MKKIFFAITVTILVQKTALAWGKQGHEMVAQFAFSLLTQKAKQNVQSALGDIAIPKAGTWMDDVRSDKKYDFLRPLHYINIDKDKSYTPSTQDNIVNEIIRAEKNCSIRIFCVLSR